MASGALGDTAEALALVEFDEDLREAIVVREASEMRRCDEA